LDKENLEKMTVGQLKKFMQKNNIEEPTEGTGAAGQPVKSDLVSTILKWEKS
jgi:hypothetical protein